MPTIELENLTGSLVAVSCLWCGCDRVAARTATAARSIWPAECPHCGYLGWREAAGAPARPLATAAA